MPPRLVAADDEFVRHIARLVAGVSEEPVGDFPRAEAIRVVQYLTGLKPGEVTLLIDEFLGPDLPLDVNIASSSLVEACKVLRHLQDVFLFGEDVVRISTKRADRFALSKAGISFSMA